MIWPNAITPLKYEGGAFDPSTLVPGIFASKTDGNDADDGLTEATAKETLDPGIEAIDSVNAVVGLYYGDEWNEQYDPGGDGIKLIPYGTPANGLPVISGMDVVTGWTLVSAATYSYEKTIVHSVSNAPNYNFLVVAEIDETDEATTPWSAYVFLTKVADAATCESTPGSFYCNNILTGSDNFIIHPSDSGNPNSNGKRYEVVTRMAAIDSYTSSGLVLYKCILKAAGYGYGPLQAGEDTWMQQSMIIGGGVHLAVVKTGTITQNVFINGPSGIPSNFMFTFYMLNGNGKKCYLHNSVFYAANQNAFYCHTNSFSERYDYVELKNNRFYGDNSTIASAISAGFEVQELYVENCYIEDSNYPLYTGAGVVTFKNCIVKGSYHALGAEHPSSPTQSITMENCLLYTDRVSAANSDEIFDKSNSNANLTIKNCIIYSKTDYTLETAAQKIIRNYAGDFITFTNNIFISDTPVANKTLFMNYGLYRDGAGGVTNGEFENNVYIVLQGTSGNGIEFRLQNPASGNISFNSWKTNSGEDQNSLFYNYYSLGLTLDDLFEDYANGDWRIKDSATHKSAIEAIGAGMTSPPTSYPDTWTKEQAVTKMIAGDLATETVWG